MDLIVRSLCYVLPITLLLFSSNSSAAILEARTSSGLSLPAAGGQRVNIVNMTVPAGEWIATAKASVINWGTADYVRCVLTSGGTIVDGATTMTGEASGRPAAAEIVTHAKLSLNAPMNVALECSHDQNVDGQKVDPGATLIVLSDSSRGTSGPAGPAGPAGPIGPVGPPVKTIALCVQPNLGPSPTTQSCSCNPPARAIITPTSSPCTAVADNGRCDANSQVIAGLTYFGACCVCAP